MKLYITDHADPSVGINPQQWIIECPFDERNADAESFEFFRTEMIKIYLEFSDSKITAEFENELRYKDEENG